MILDRLVEIVEDIEPAVVEHDAGAAHLADLPHVVADEDRIRGLHPFPEHRLALAPEGGIADRRHLVDQIGVEADPHRHPEGETRAHARGIDPDRFIEEIAKLGEILDKGHQLLGIDAVDAGNEAGVLRPRQLTVEGPAKAHRERDRPVRGDAAAIGAHGAGDHLHQRRLPGAIAPEQGQRRAGGQRQVEIVDHHPALALHPEALGQVLEADHGSAAVPDRIEDHRRDRPGEGQEQGHQAENDPAAREFRGLGQGRADIGGEIAALPRGIGAGHVDRGEGGAIGLLGELLIDIQPLVFRDQVRIILGQGVRLAGGAGEALPLLDDLLADHVDAAVGLFEPRIVARAALLVAQQVAVDQRLRQLLLQVVEHPHPASEVRGRIDHLRPGAELRHRLARGLQPGKRGVEILERVAHRVLARRRVEVVDHLLALAHHLGGDLLRVLGREGEHPHLDQPGRLIIGDPHHPLPVAQQILDRGIGRKRKDRIPGPVLRIEADQVDPSRNVRNDFLALDELIEDIAVARTAAGADELRQPAQKRGRPRGAVLLAHGEPHGRGILVACDQPQIERGDEERDQHHRGQAVEQPAMAALHRRGGGQRPHDDRRRFLGGAPPRSRLAAAHATGPTPGTGAGALRHLHKFCPFSRPRSLGRRGPRPFRLRPGFQRVFAVFEIVLLCQTIIQVPPELILLGLFYIMRA
ncbi:hypothetical protein SDC9_21399 [bioreactor metagenome]|uniref:Uncharacterized protein n=1 Tax=bioreactor metagenome TaxID=1076179 RepID=A0A644U9Q0_9ZZZZ